MTACIIVCTIIALGMNFILVCAAVGIALKAMAKQLSAVIDECERVDKTELFVKQWIKHNR